MSVERDDIGIDARLRRALASAPDAQVEPPAALDEAILRAAHAALPKAEAVSGSRKSRGLRVWLKRWWAHPAAAPVFAVLALSTVIVSMWTRHGVPSPSLEEDARVAAAPASDVAKVARPTAVGGTDTAVLPAAPPATTTDSLSTPIAEARKNGESADKEEARVEAKAVTPKPAPTSQPSPAVNQARRDGGELNRLADKSDQPPPPKEAALRARQQAQAGRRETERDERAASAEASREVAAAPAPAAPFPSSAPPPSMRATEEGRVAAASPAQQERTTSATPAAAKAAAAGSVTSTLPESAPTSPRRDTALDARVATADAPPLALTLEAAAAWQWRSDPSQTPAAIDDRARAWFARLEAASQGRWVRADQEQHAKAKRSPDARTFELWREQALWATIVIGPSDATWLDASGRMWRAALAADALAALRSW
jgi:hypothetical protein